MYFHRSAWAEIDLAAVQSNLEAIRSLIGPQTALLAVVKANAYGHGAVEVARSAVASGAERLGVALVEELLELREAGLRVPIQLLSEAPSEAAPTIVQAAGLPTICSLPYAQALGAAAFSTGRKLRVHIKIDTGMHRIGVATEDAVEFLAALRRLPGLEVEGIFTHFATADSPGEYRERQLARFESLISDLRSRHECPPLVHAANSAAAILMPESRYDMVRIGIAMYGLHPGKASHEVIDLHPVLSLRARISQVVSIPLGDGVSYGATLPTHDRSAVATLPLGYADGYRRALSNRGWVLLCGQRAPVVGNVTMDQLMVRVPESCPVASGTVATLVGRDGDEEVSADELAELSGTINYEIVTAISPRVPRIYKPAPETGEEV